MTVGRDDTSGTIAAHDAEGFARFRELVADPDRIAGLAAAADVEREWLDSALTVSLAETDFSLRWLARWLKDGQRVLEVGSGLGLTSAYLASTGIDVCSIEPGGIGFERYERVNPLLRASLGIAHPHLTMPVEDISAAAAGTFDLVFSNNVLEHVADVDRTMVALGAVLRPGGVIVHNCPNYHVPYEPHFGIPLLPGWPALTARVLPSRITSTGLWRSLNFVTARQMRRIAAEHGATVQFQRGVLADAFDRFGEPEFALRHRVLARFAGPLRVLAPVLRRIPPSLATPMIVSWRTALPV